MTIMTKNPENFINKDVLKGGEFLIKDSDTTSTFIPEQLNEEQLMVKEMCLDFLKNELAPLQEKIEKQEEGISQSLLKKMGELGLLGSHMPVDFGGMEMTTNTNTLICDVLGPMGSFATTFAAHTGIGMLPILYFGTEEQKQKYLPGLSSGQLIGCYCLTEPGAGSDANSGRTKAELTEDGKHYKINGQKMWISNAGYADVFIVFARIEDDKYITGFIVDKGSPVFGIEYR